MLGNLKIVIAHPNEENALVQGQGAWEADFVYFLSMLLAEIMGEKPNISTINPNNQDAQKHVDEATAFVTLFDEHHKGTDFLLDISTRFVKRMQSQNTFYVGGRYSFFKVLKRPIRNPKLLSFVDTVFPYAFYDIDVLKGTPRVFDQRIGSPTQRAYWLKLADVCYDLSHILRHAAGQIQEEYSPKRTIYLAAVGADMISMRDVMRRELTQRGYKVLPEQALPTQAADVERATHEDLKKCTLAIHMLGEDYGKLLPGENISILALQNKIAHAYTLSVLEQRKQNPDLPTFNRLIWLNPNIEKVTERQRLFIEEIKSEAATIEEAEVMEVPLEEFQFIVREKLAKHQAITPIHLTEEGPEKYVYLIHDFRDKEAVTPLANLLIDAGLKVLALSHEGTPAELRYEHQEHLKRCHGSIIYIKTASEQWFGSRLQDLFKAPAFGRKHPMRAKAVIFDRDIDFDTNSLGKYITILNGGKGISIEALGPFLNAIKNK